ncbi:hypothetical protein F2Q70_00005321 [Brassica cretica]|uniref:Thioredoxin domain-containing protein n=1 Tax=Brassica cretica TaxID=69181 RepID=A0A3N6QHS2_BRACR|nr:hypothetical protein F2Q70_00005321 [Brassica cretica]KAF3568077.1 hypothetical protein DY000_02017610 [Brassica cretica]
MGDTSFLDRMLLQLRSTCKYYSGYPKDLGPSRVIHFTSERESNYTQHLDRMLEEAAAEFYPNIKFMRVECPKYPGFCITRQKSEYPFIEIFHSPQQAGNEGKVQDPNVTRYSVKVVPYNYDMSPYGFREFFKRQGVRTSDPK